MMPRSPFSSGSFRSDLRRGEPNDVEGSRQVDVDHRSEEVERERPVIVPSDHARRRAYACAVHGAVERVERVDEALDAVLLRYVGIWQVRHDCMTARLLEQACRRGAEAGGATGDEEGLAGDVH